MHSHDRARGFTIVEGCILTAGIALGFSLIRAIAPELTKPDSWAYLAYPPGGWSPIAAYERYICAVVFMMTPLLIACTPAVLILQAAGPRPPWRRLRRQPGFVACLLATALMAIAAVIGLLCLLLRGTPASRPTLERSLELFPNIGLVGIGILCGWGAMKVCGAWRPVPSRRDRLGRLVGALWVVVAATGIISALGPPIP